MCLRSLMVIFISSCCSLSFMGQAQGEDAPLILVYDTIGKAEWLASPWGKMSGGGIFYENVQSPPHLLMRRVALLTGRHAFFSAVYGEFPSHNRFEHRALEGEKSRLLPGILYPKGKKGLSRLQNETIIVLGKDFAWIKREGLLPRVETREIAPEDIGATIKYLFAEKISQPFPGRNVAISEEWANLPTHVGSWEGDLIPARMAFRGGRVLLDKGNWEDGLVWKGEEVTALSQQELLEYSTVTASYQQWWKSALSSLSQSVALRGPGTTYHHLELTPNDWCASIVLFGLPYMPVEGIAWTEDSLRNALVQIKPPGIGGSWKVNIIREGNYELTFSLNPFDKKEKTPLLFRKGEALIRLGGSMVKMDIMQDASEVTVLVDFAPGEQSLEINIISEDSPDVSLSVPYARLKYTGERKTPVISFPGGK